MGKTFQIARIAGVPVAIDAGLALLATLFWLVLSLQVLPLASPGASFSQTAPVAAATVIAFMLSILAHELGHAAVAKRNDIVVLGISLNLFGGYAKLDRQAPTPASEFAIAVAGPAVNLLLGGLFVGLAFAVRPTNISLLIGAVAWLAGMNIILAVVNLFPAAPLDGGRVLTAILWRQSGDPNGARIVSGRIGLIVGVIVCIAGIAGLATRRSNGLPLVVVGVFLLFGARSEIRSATIRRRLKTSLAADVMAPIPTAITDSATAERLLSLTQGRHHQIVPISRWQTQVVGYVLPASALAIAPIERSWTSVSDLMQPDRTVARAWTTETVDQILDRQPAATPMFSVVHDPDSGKVVGAITEAQLTELFSPPTVWGNPRNNDRSSESQLGSETANPREEKTALAG